jgi:hypothetical protein
MRRLETLFNDFTVLLEPRPGDRALAIGDRCQAVVTLIRAEADAAGLRVSLDIALDMPPMNGRERVLVSSLWPETASSAGGLALRKRSPDKQ